MRIATFQQYVEAIYEEFASPLNIFFSKAQIDQIPWLNRCGVIGAAFPVYHYIRVTRNDLVAQAVSFLIAMQTRQWTSLHASTNAVLRYDFEKISNAIAHFALLNAKADIYFSLIGANPVCFIYEEIIADLAQVGPKLQSLTGISAMPCRPRTLPVEIQSRPEKLDWARRYRAEFAKLHRELEE